MPRQTSRQGWRPTASRLRGGHGGDHNRPWWMNAVPSPWHSPSAQPAVGCCSPRRPSSRRGGRAAAQEGREGRARQAWQAGQAGQAGRRRQLAQDRRRQLAQLNVLGQPCGVVGSPTMSQLAVCLARGRAPCMEASPALPRAGGRGLNGHARPAVLCPFLSDVRQPLAAIRQGLGVQLAVH